MWEGLAEGRTVWLLLATATQLAVLTCQARVDCAIEAGVDFPGNDYATVRPGQRGHDGYAFRFCFTTRTIADIYRHTTAACRLPPTARGCGPSKQGLPLPPLTAAESCMECCVGL